MTPKVPKIRDTYMTPAGGWWLVDPDTEAYLQANSYRNLKGVWEQHRKSNGLPALDYDKAISEQICKHAPESFCEEWPIARAGKNISKGPTLVEMLANFTESITFWASKGFPVSSQELFDKRIETCRKCEYWDEKAAMGAGRCMKCGCTGIKHWLRTSKCPLNKW